MIQLPKTHMIETSKGNRVIIGEHPGEVYLCLDRNGCGISGFLSPAEAEEVGLKLYRLARAIKRKG